MNGDAYQIEREIEAEKDALGNNLAELEQQAKELVDWRTQVRKNPRAMMGAAVGGGMLLASLTRPRRSRSHESGSSRPREHSSNGGGASSAAHDAWETFKGALFGAAVSRVSSVVAELLPDFHEQLESQRRSRGARRWQPRTGSASNGHTEQGSE